ncbi:MAG: IspD/TarI family cytidylyltransferase [Planctomycetota bacterium]
MSLGKEQRIAVILPAAGFSGRFNADSDAPRSKLDEDLGGRPVLHRAVELFANRPEVCAVIVAGPRDPDAMTEFKLRHGDKLSILGVTLVPGGETHRWETVREALAAVPEDASHIAVHDAARPITPPELIDSVFDAATRHDAVIPVVRVTDTIKKLSEEPEPDGGDPLAAILGAGTGRADAFAVEETVARERLAFVQTPQVFTAELLRDAYERFAGKIEATDDAGLVEAAGARVIAVEGSPKNLKLTTRDDLDVIRVLGGFKGPSERPTHKRF